MAALTNGNSKAAAAPFPPVTARPIRADGTVVAEERLATLELEDGTVYQGYSFGAEKSVSGELVFQTGIFSRFPSRCRSAVTHQLSSGQEWLGIRSRSRTPRTGGSCLSLLSPWLGITVGRHSVTPMQRDRIDSLIAIQIRFYRCSLARDTG